MTSLGPSNRDKKIYICNGSACMTAGTQANLKNKYIKSFLMTNESGKCAALADVMKIVLSISMV